MLYLRHPKSRGHYRRSNDIVFTLYPTLHELSVGIIGVDREVWVEFFNQGGGWSISIKGNQPLRSKFFLISGSSSSKTTFLLAYIDLRMFNFLYISWFFSLINLSLSKDGVEEEVDVLWALVFLTMMLRIGKDRQEKKKKKKTKNKTKQNKLYDVWIVLTHDACFNALRTALLDCKKK